MIEEPTHDGEAVEPTPPRRPSPGWTEIAVGAVAYLLLGLGLGLLMVLLVPDALRPGSVTSSLLLIAASGVAALGAFGLALAPRIRSLAAFGVRSTTGRWLLIGLGGGVLAWLVNRGIIIGYVLISGDDSNPQADLANGVNAGPWALAGTLLLAAVLVPIGEELLFRGVLTTALGRYGVWVAVLVSALVFALAHGVSIVLPAAFVLGAVNALMLRRSGSVWPGVIAHGVNNALVFGLAAVLT